MKQVLQMHDVTYKSFPPGTSSVYKRIQKILREQYVDAFGAITPIKCEMLETSSMLHDMFHLHLIRPDNSDMLIFTLLLVVVASMTFSTFMFSFS